MLVHEVLEQESQYKYLGHQIWDNQKKIEVIKNTRFCQDSIYIVQRMTG